MEIERKFIIKNYPSYSTDIKTTKLVIINQYYLDIKNIEMRVQEEFDSTTKSKEYYLVIKSTNKELSRTEHVIKIDREKYETLKNASTRNTYKSRAFHKMGDLEFTLDEYYGGLLLLEIEFETEKQAKEFDIAVLEDIFVLEEVTGNKDFYSYNLAQKTNNV